MSKELTPEKEARNFDKQRDKRSGDNKPLTKAEKERAKELARASKMRKENTKNSYLEPFEKISQDPLSYVKFLVEQGDFYDREGRKELISLVTLVKIQQALESFNLNLKSRK